MIMEFRDYLINQGLNPEIADDAHDVVHGKNDSNAELSLKHKLQWMDDETHDYSGEIIDMYRDWQLKVNEITYDEWELRMEVDWPHLPESNEVSKAEIYAKMQELNGNKS